MSNPSALSTIGRLLDRPKVVSIMLGAGLVATVLALAWPSPALACCCFGHPHAPQCFVAVCTGSDGWDFEPNPGASCNYAATAGTCDDYGQCLTSESTRPTSVLVTILYTPPGQQSSVSYGSGNTTGNSFSATWTDGTTTQLGGQISLGGGPLTAGGFTAGDNVQWTFSHSHGIFNSIRKTTGSSYTQSNPSSASDYPDHGEDTFFLWMNPMVTVILANGYPDSQTWSTSDGGSMLIYYFTARELEGIDSVPWYKQPPYNQMTASDRATYVAQDPFVQNSSPYLDPKRFQKVDHITLYGPDHSWDPIISVGYSVSYNSENDTSYGSGVNQADTVIMGFSINLLDIIKINFSDNTTYTSSYTETRTNVSGDQQTATMTMRTPTVCFALGVDVYIDAAFSSYVGIPTGTFSCTAPAMAASLRTSSGQPIANQVIRVRNADGTSQQVLVSGDGSYRIY